MIYIWIAMHVYLKDQDMENNMLNNINQIYIATHCKVSKNKQTYKKTQTTINEWGILVLKYIYK